MLRRTTHGVRVDWHDKKDSKPMPPKPYRDYFSSREISGKEARKAAKATEGYFKIQRFMERIGVHIL